MSRGNSQTLTINKKSSFFGQKIRSKNATTAPTSEGQGGAYILRLYGTRSEDTYWFGRSDVQPEFIDLS